MKRVWLHRLGMLIAVLGGLGFLVYALSSVRISDLKPYLSVQTLLALVAAAVFYAGTVPLSAWSWQRLLCGLGSKQPLIELTRILLVTQIGKYLPGNIGQHIGRIGMSLGRGIPAAPLTASIAYEVLLLMLAGVMTGLAAGLMSSIGTSVLLQNHGSALGIAIAVGIVGLLTVPALGWALPRMFRRFVPVSAGMSLRLPLAAALQAFAAYILAYVAIGVGIGVLSVALFPQAQQDFALLTAAFAVAWVAGFVTPGAPAGIGVREGVLTLLLAGSIGALGATALILALRLATILGDILCLVTGLVIGSGSGRGAPAVDQ